MYIEEFYNDGDKTKNKTRYYYTATLAAFLVNPDLSIYDRVVESFEEKEEYEVCAGMHAAITYIEDLYEEALRGLPSDKELEVSDDGYIEFSTREHAEANRKIYQQIITEIYEQQAKAD